jgi:arylsulfatase A-like enzyme/HEAT repeat protein
MSERRPPTALRVIERARATPCRESRIVSWLIDAAAIMAVWAGALVAETVVLGFLERDQFSGVWEIAIARYSVVPLATTVLSPVALVVASGWRLSTTRSRVAARTLASLGGLAGAAVAFGVSGGRHFSNPLVRAAFVLALAVATALLTVGGLPRVAVLRRRPVRLASLALVLGAGAWFADGHVLPRLYPTFHATLFVVTLLSCALLAFAVRAETRAHRALSKLGAVAVLGLVLHSAAKIPGAVSALDRATNLRIVLVEHAPLLGPVVALTMRWHPPDAGATVSDGVGHEPTEVARSLEWSNRDIVLLTVDALRADHVSAYGYPRATTPNIDDLAHEGTLFESAYCPTPHTSYSITSMMTGKYLRPLLALGLGGSSETWAQDLRRYGWRTAAFYPPAVFFIDRAKFAGFEDDRLGFEYAKVEFADPVLREKQVAEYLDTAAVDRPLFLWVHFFEPHEPYVQHPEHPFYGGVSPDVDAYDSEVATADDGIGRVVRLVRTRRAGAAFVVTADHGEEFGEHGGRYHGTTVYEEQVRVPLIVAGAGVRPGARVRTVVQTIDLLPTALSAVGIPRPARVRGRDLGPILVGDARAMDDGFAFAETDDYSLAASGPDRLVCHRRAAACALYRPEEDPLERRDLGAEGPRGNELRARLRSTEADHGRYEAAGGPAWPEPLRRGLQGEIDAAIDVAALLDDADVSIRRKAAEVCFALHAPGTAEELKRALAGDEDEEVRRWAALALTRIGPPIPALADVLLRDAGRAWRRPAALALAERGDSRSCDELAAWWIDALPASAVASSDEGPPRLTIDLLHAQELLAATRTARCRAAVPALIRALEDVRARPFVADTLGVLGDERARGPLLDLLSDEPYVTTRPHEARALLALGAHDWASDEPVVDVQLSLAWHPPVARLVVLLSEPAAALALLVDGQQAVPLTTEGDVRVFQLPAGSAARARRARFAVHVSGGGVLALWLAPIGGT